MSNTNAIWFKLNTEQRKEEISNRRKKNESFAKIALSLLGSEKNKPTIWSWARRNMSDHEIYPKMRSFGLEPYGTYSDVERWTTFDIISSLFPRLDAMSEHLLVEMNNILTDQHRNFTITAGFLDDLEKRVIEAIGRNTAVLTTRVSSAIPQARGTSPPPPPRVGILGAPPPPPPSGTILSPQETMGSGSIRELRTDFEEMSMEEITSLPQEFLEALTPVDRNRLQTRVKELKKIEKMSPEEREEYLRKKQEEKERTEAAEGLGTSLSSMLNDSDSLFARMRSAADDSLVSGSGTFGKFTVDYTYYYCFACGKMNRSEDETLDECEYCGAGEEQMVMDEEKSNYKFWECLSSKNRESIDINYSRGKQIIVRSRWKSPIDGPMDPKGCEMDNIREITGSVHVKADPDKQFSHYLTLFRMYTHLNLQGDLKTYLADLSDEIQKLPDLTMKDQANTQAYKIMDKLIFLLKWIESRKIIEVFPSSKDLQIQIENLRQDIKLLQDPESPQELRKASEIGQIASKTDQVLNRFTSILIQIESELLLPSKWKCSMCDGSFEVKDRQNIPEQCPECGKIITKLTPMED
ncbi:MAG: hypothetical protein ACW97X_07780 [Candidatus Hodarchaeales archaeon]|jgi:rubrerythrin